MSIINSCKVRKLEFKTSDKPIKCYKIFKIENNTYYGPFTNYEFPLIYENVVIEPQLKTNITYKLLEKIFPALYKKYICSNRHILLNGISYNKENDWYDVTSGFLHTLPYKPDSLKSYCYDCGTYELWECEIPKLTIYVQADCRGSHYEANGTYASKQLKLIKKLDSITI